MENPNHGTSHPSKEDLRKYAFYRAKNDAENNKEVLTEWRKNTEKEITEIEGYSEPLSINTQKVIKIQLSWGGDGDGYKITLNKDNEILHGVYYWEDWGCYEEIELSEEELNNIVEIYFYGDITAYLE